MISDISVMCFEKSDNSNGTERSCSLKRWRTIFLGPATYRMYCRDQQNSVSIVCIFHDHVVRQDINPLLSPFE